MNPNQIIQIGRALRDHFNLSELLEFSFEVEVKSVTPERVEAMKEIGVSHARFGLQTFSPTYRELFALTATIEQIEKATVLLQTAFRNVSCDLLYGMNGQTVDELEADIEGAHRLGLKNVDLYPINNLVTQHKLHLSFQRWDDHRHQA